MINLLKFEMIRLYLYVRLRGGNRFCAICCCNANVYFVWDIPVCALCQQSNLHTGTTPEIPEGLVYKRKQASNYTGLQYWKLGSQCVRQGHLLVFPQKNPCSVHRPCSCLLHLQTRPFETEVLVLTLQFGRRIFVLKMRFTKCTLEALIEVPYKNPSCSTRYVSCKTKTSASA